MENLERKNISSQIAEKLKNKIINGEMKIGEKLPSEFELCKIYEVSRSTIRSSLQVLVTSGLVETIFGSGSYVKSNKTNVIVEKKEGYNSLNDIYVIRKILEPNICKIVCEKILESDIKDLVQIVSKIENNKSNIGILKENVLKYHLKLAEITGNNYLINTLSKSLIDLSTYDIDGIQSNIEIYYHKEILKALLQKDNKLAFSLMEVYIDEFGQNI